MLPFLLLLTNGCLLGDRVSLRECNFNAEEVQTQQHFHRYCIDDRCPPSGLRWPRPRTNYKLVEHVITEGKLVLRKELLVEHRY